jgi:hypothetical protein
MTEAAEVDAVYGDHVKQRSSPTSKQRTSTAPNTRLPRPNGVGEAPSQTSLEDAESRKNLVAGAWS